MKFSKIKKKEKKMRRGKGQGWRKDGLSPFRMQLDGGEKKNIHSSKMIMYKSGNPPAPLFFFSFFNKLIYSYIYIY